MNDTEDPLVDKPVSVLNSYKAGCMKMDDMIEQGRIIEDFYPEMIENILITPLP